MKRLGMVSAAFALAWVAQPAHANPHDWDTASTIATFSLGAAALGVPAVQRDWGGLEQAGGSILVAGGIAQGLKRAFHEERPDGSGNDSFPSGHTSVAFASAMTLERRYGWRVGVPALLVASFVGVARVQARRHHWYDALAGAAIGTASGLVITRRHDQNVRLVPWGDTHGGGAELSVRF